MRAFFFLSILLAASPVYAETFQAGPTDDVESTVNQLQPGDELVLADGTYTLSGRFGVDIAGTQAAPIVIRAAEGAVPHFDRPEANQNIWDIRAEWVEIRGLKFTGGSAGLRFEAARDVTIDGCEISETADVALRMNDGGQDYERMTITNNHIHETAGTGEGMYLGCNNDGCRLSDSLIASNYVHHTNAGNVSQGDGIEIKEGSFGNIIRDNVIHDTNYPCILTYSTTGNGAANLIERNVMWNCGDHGIQSAADATIRNNIILGAAGAGIAAQPHQSGAPSNLRIVHNTIINEGRAIAVRNATGEVIVANNAIYSETSDALFVNGDVSFVTAAGNVGNGGSTVGGIAPGDIFADFEAAQYGMAPADVYPGSGSALIGAGDAAYATLDDFNGMAREGSVDVGAYQYDDSGNPGWAIAPEFKIMPPPTLPVEDMGVGMPDFGTRPDAGTTADAGNAGTSDMGSTGPDAGTNLPEPGAGTESGSDESCSTVRSAETPLGGLILLVGFFVLRLRRRSVPRKRAGMKCRSER